MADRYRKRHMTELWSDYSDDEGRLYGCIPKFDRADKFIDEKVNILKDQMYIQVTDEDIEYLRQFKTEGDINAAVKRIINKYWE